MNKIILKHFLFFLLIIARLSAAQGLLTGATSVLHPSPTAASLGKFTEVPVALYTGVPSISVPLWQLQQGDLKVDVGLSYHSGGIRVDEMASWVGLGWALNAGGMITRSTRGLPDDLKRYGRFDMPQLTRFIGLTPPTMSATEQRQYVEGVSAGVYDAEPDLYSLSLPGISCQFFMNKDGNFVSTSRELNLTIQYDTLDAHGTRYKWLITDSKGVQYKFLDVERSETTAFSFGKDGTSSTSGSTFNGETSWGLNEMEDTKGNKVSFRYEADGNNFGNIVNEFRTVVTVSETGAPRCIGKEDRGYTYVDTQGSALRLVAITCGQEEIGFAAANADRLDAPYAHALQRITVSYANRVKRAFTFYTSYLTGSAIGTHGTYYPRTANQFRLQLDSVREESGDGRLVKPAYRFTYNAGSLPFRGSAAQDYWGFFNGQDNTTRVSYSVGNQRLGAQKEPVFTYGVVGTLATIRYPTGGTTAFTYEANQYHRNPADTPLPVDSTFAQVQVETYQQDGNSPWDVQGYEAQQTFDITPTVVANAPGYPTKSKLALQLLMNLRVDGATVSQQDGYTTSVQLQRVTSSGLTPVGLSFPADSGRIAYVTPGRYVLSVQVEKEFPWQQDRRVIHLDASLSADISTSAFAATKVYTGPGLRIKQILKDFGNGHTEKTSYRYTDPITGTTSGLLGNQPDYSRHGFAQFVWEETASSSITSMGTYLCGCTKYSSDSHYPLINTRGSHVGYSYVAEYKGEDETAGYTAYRYTNYDLYNDLNATPLFPYPPLTSHETRRGVPLLEQTYADPVNSMTTGARLVKSDSTTYDVLPLSLDWTYGVKMGNIQNMGSLETGTDVHLTVDDYANTRTATYRLEADSFQPQLKSTKQVAAGNTWQSTIVYQYTADTFLPKRLTSTTSDGSTLVQRFYYPTDYRANASSSPLIASLLAANRVGVPLEQNTLRYQINSARLTAGTVHEYRVLPDLTGIGRFSLWKIHTAMTTGTDTTSHYGGLSIPAYYEEKEKVAKTTARGEPLLEITNRYQIRSYKWGYDDRYPIAACTNAVDDEFFQENFEEVTSAQVGAAHSGEKYNASGYTVTWTRPNNRQYLLRYWYRQSGKWYLRQLPYTGSSYALTGGDAYDDVSIYPADARLTTYTYEPLVGETSVTSPDGRTVSYEYDGLGRLVRTRDEQGRILSQQKYHYAGQH